jgi:hypothetical protein
MKQRFSRRILVLVFVLLGLAGRVSAGSIPLFSTGVNTTGTPLAGGSIDPHWAITAGPGITSPASAFVVTNPAGSYAMSPGSSWIWVNADGSGGTGSSYSVELTFSLTRSQASTASLSGMWGVDNNGSIDLNGSAATGTGALSLTGGTENNFDLFHSFTITGGFVAGVNKVDFLAEDDENPGALNVNNLILTATSGTVPEPSSLLMAGIGLGLACGFVAMKRLRWRGQDNSVETH